ncbi:MAG: lytic transglycosylase domain-containing protein [Candidatus Gastranaerophilales bacterium]|nr:lytic transglycosylase domain-containing protein [Candidatus Gastranaerophilales bacterium]
MEITGLEITLQRINNIERQFEMLTGEDKKPDKDFQSILDSSMRSNYGSDVSKAEINQLIEEYSAKNGLDPDFVRAVVKQESGFNEHATSRCGAAGLMQLMPGTAKSLGVVNPYDAEDNVKGGTKMLANLLKTYGGNKELALAAYNAGGGAVKKYGGIPPYGETQRYVKNVLSIYNRYKGGA